MKNTFFLMCIFCHVSFLAISQKTLTFDITKAAGAVLVNDKITEEEIPLINIEKGETLKLKIKANPGQQYSFNITKARNVVATLSNNDFNNDELTASGASLAIKGVPLADASFKIIFTSGSTFTRSFKISVVQKEDNAAIPPPLPDQILKKEPIKIYKPGSAIYDALALAHAADLGLYDVDVINILKNYFKNENAGTLTDFKADIANSPFLKNVIDVDALNTTLKKPPQDTTAQSFFGSLASASLSSVGGLDVTNIADGFAKFLVKRTKEELSVTFFTKFKETITSPEYADLRTVFPQTYRALLVIGDEVYQYEAYIQKLRENFENDLASLDKNLPSIIENHEDFFTTHPELAVILSSGCYVASALEDKEHPGDIIHDFPVDDEYWNSDKMNKNWKGAIQTIQLISASLRDTADNKDSVYWVSTKKIKELIKDKTAFQIYLGLLYQVAKTEYDNIQFEGDKSLVKFLDIVADSLPNYRSSYEQFIQRFGEKAGKLNVMIKAYRKPANDSLAFEQYYQYFKASVDLIQSATEISKLPVIRNNVPSLPADMADYFEVAHSSGDLVIDINRRNYTSAVVNAVHIYDLVRAKYTGKGTLSKKEKEALKKNADIQASNEIASDILKNIRNNGTDTFIVTKSLLNSKSESLLSQSDSVIAISLDDTYKKMYKYGAFMAAMVQAKSSDDVEKTIEAFALPSGSARIKRVSAFNVSLNAYVGLFTGYEKIKDLDDDFKLNTWGVTAPIGVAASWGNKILFFNTGKTQWSTSIFVSLIDLGTVTAFRFKDTVTAQVPTIELKDIFSPGVFLSFGIPKTPISVNFGTQMGPNLREVNVTTADNTNPHNDFNNKTYLRYSLSVCVDIPILNFYTKPK